MFDGTVLSSSAARVTPPVRATVEKVTRSDNSMGAAPFRFQDGRVLRKSFIENDRRAYGICPDRRNGYADQHAIDCSFGHPASDPAGADGCGFRRTPDGGGERRWRFWDSRRGLRC